VRNAGTVDWGGCSVGNPHYSSDAGGGVWSDAGLSFLAVGQQALFTGSQSPNTTLNYSISLPYNCGSVPPPSPPADALPVTVGCESCYSLKTYSIRLLIWPGGKPIDDDNDHPPECERSDCNTCGGMPVWRVSQPYINLWIKDEPMGYQPATGPRVSFTLNYNQSEFISGVDPHIFSVGRKWSFPWLSYVAKDASANNVVYLPGGGRITFTNSADFLTNTRLTGDTTNGFTLFHPDGSKDVYSFVVTNSSGGFLKAFLKEKWNAINQKSLLDYSSYTPGDSPVVRLLDVVDGDGRTNIIYYATNNAFSTNLIAQVVDPFSRTTSNSLRRPGAYHEHNRCRRIKQRNQLRWHQ